MEKIHEQLSRDEICAVYRYYIPNFNPRGKTWRGPCPIHRGKRDSFSVDMETGRWFCHSECNRGGDTVELVKSMENLSEFKAATMELGEIVQRSLMNESRPARRVAEYVYCDEEASPLFRVIRTDPKGFYQEHWNGEAWVKGVRGVRRVLYCLPMISLMQRVFVFEGEKDADRFNSTACSETAVGTTASMGAGKWRPEYADCLKGKDVVVVPDQDQVGQEHAELVAKSVKAVASSVRVLNLPGAKDFSDWMDTGGTIEKFLELADKGAVYEEPAANGSRSLSVGAGEAFPPSRPQGRGAAPASPPSDPGDGSKAKPNMVAENVKLDHMIITTPTGNMYEYLESGFWAPLSKDQVKYYAGLAEPLETTTAARRREIIDYIAATTLVPKLAWQQIPEHCCPLRNGLVNLLDGSIAPHRPDNYLLAVVPHEYDMAAECPLWLKVLDDWFGLDEEGPKKIAALQEFFGYCLMTAARYKKGLVLYGPTDTGKSLAGEILQEMLGRDNCSAVEPENLGDPNCLSEIKGKMCNLAGDLRSNAMIADGGFKKLVSSGGDMVSINEKYEKRESVVLFAKHVIITNTLPHVTDLTRATFNRLLIITYNHTLSPLKIDVELMSKLRPEIPGIISWAVDGATRLAKNRGQFTEIQESNSTLREYRLSNNDVFPFLEEKTIESAGSWINYSEFHSKFCEWNKKYLSKNLVGRMLAALGWTPRRVQMTDGTFMQVIYNRKWVLDAYGVPTQESLQLIAPMVKQ